MVQAVFRKLASSPRLLRTILGVRPKSENRMRPAMVVLSNVIKPKY